MHSANCLSACRIFLYGRGVRDTMLGYGSVKLNEQLKLLLLSIETINNCLRNGRYPQSSSKPRKGGNTVYENE